MAEHVLTADEAAAVRRLNDAYLRRIRREQDNHFDPRTGVLADAEAGAPARAAVVAARRRQ